jgi:phosphoribosylpyrophosphate synthetase
MQSLGPLISKIITFETHSSATQAFAALAGIPLAPISYEEELIGQINHQLRNKNFDPTNWKVVRPDIGRNLVATRIEDHFGIEGVHINQVRDSDTLVKEAIALSEELKQKLKGTNVILYDDEAGTFGTIKNVANKLISAEVKSINIFLGHARLQQRWTANIKWIIEKCRKKNISLKVYVTDSRMPVGGLRDFMNQYPGTIKIVSVAKKTRNVIEANVKGVDFWTETNFNGINYEGGLLQYAKNDGQKDENN